MEGSSKPKLLVIGGPTATGKTALSVALAKQFDGEIISADSMQIYRGLDVGTAKVTVQEMDGVPHHLLNIRDPEEVCSVAEYVELARRAITEITRCNHLPIVVGGTGLYISSLLKGIRFTPAKTDPALRAELERQWEEIGAQAMYDRLAVIDPQAAAATHPNNKVRVLRALELCSSGKTKTEQDAEALAETSPYNALCLALHYLERAQLYARIDTRVDKMLAEGLLTEAMLVYDNRDRYTTAAQAIGYKEFFPYFEEKQTLETCTEECKRASRRYAKRQLTWFGHMPDIRWLDAGDENMREKAIALTQVFLEQQAE